MGSRIRVGPCTAVFTCLEILPRSFPGVFRTRWSGDLPSSSLRPALRSSGSSRFRGTHAVRDLVRSFLQGFAGGTSACARASSCSRVSEVDEWEKLGGFVPAGFATACRRGTDPDRRKKTEGKDGDPLRAKTRSEGSMDRDPWRRSFGLSTTILVGTW